MKVAVSFLSLKDDLETTIKKINESSAEYFHVDMMDGIFVPNTTYTVADLKKIFKNVDKKLDVHLMCCSPNKYVREIAKLPNVEYLTIHYESHRRPIDVINMIRHTSMKVGIAINPETKVSHIVPLLKSVDQVLVMSVHPGKGGQEFIEDILYKIETLRDIREENNYHFIISVDGGINDKTAKLVKEAGADMVVSGSYVVKDDNYEKQIETIR